MSNVGEVIRGLEMVMSRHQNDKYSPFDTRWTEIISECHRTILELDGENKKLNKMVEKLQGEVKEDHERTMDKELELAFM